jgi:hypothetical protein
VASLAQRQTALQAANDGLAATIARFAAAITRLEDRVSDLSAAIDRLAGRPPDQ